MIQNLMIMNLINVYFPQIRFYVLYLIPIVFSFSLITFSYFDSIHFFYFKPFYHFSFPCLFYLLKIIVLLLSSFSFLSFSFFARLLFNPYILLYQSILNIRKIILSILNIRKIILSILNIRKIRSFNVNTKMYKFGYFSSFRFFVPYFFFFIHT